MDYYNHRRTHHGYKLKENGYNTPAEAYLLGSKEDLTIEGASYKIASMMDRKMVREKTILTGQVLGDDFIEVKKRRFWHINL